MAKLIPDAVIDEQLEPLALATILVICAGQPTTYADATTVIDLATHVLAPADFSKAPGDVSGRKLTLAAQSNITVDHDGHADHFMLGISASSKLLYIGTLSEPHKTFTAGDLANFPTTDIDEIGDVT